jgi:hypothetical protein
MLIAAALAAGAAVATTHATEGSRPDIKVIASEVARGLIGGIILGANVGPYLSGLIPAHIESRVTASGYAPAQPPDSYSPTSDAILQPAGQPAEGGVGVRQAQGEYDLIVQ